MEIPVTKMHALGNNYVYVEAAALATVERPLPDIARAVSDVRRGIGSDGLIVMGSSTVADVSMRIFNADGSEAENCGNGLRCVAKYAYEHGLVSSTEFRIEAKGGIYLTHVRPDAQGQVPEVTVNMGAVRIGRDVVPYAGPSMSPEGGVDEDIEVRVPLSAAAALTGTLVSVGNPHFVTFVEDATEVDVRTIGPLVEHHPWFPERINVEFVSVRSRHEIDFRVWERGSGITYACGTGACASVAAGVRQGMLGNQVRVNLLGGSLFIEIIDDEIWMTGETVHVFSGTYAFE